MLCGPKEGATEQEYDFAEWTEEEKQAGDHRSVMEFVRPYRAPKPSAGALPGSLGFRLRGLLLGKVSPSCPIAFPRQGVAWTTLCAICLLICAVLATLLNSS